MKKYLTYFVITATLLSLFVPVAGLRAQTCNPDNLQQVRYGQRSAAVRNLQACLMELDYDIPAGATGYYGPQTRNAVKAFYNDYLNMTWHGNNVGPQGVEALKSALAKAPSKETQAQQPSQPGVSAEVLAQILQKIQAGDTAGALALLLQALGGQVPTTTQQQATTTQQQVAQEGFLVVERDPSATGVTVREGETANVFGLRFRADNAPVTVKSIFLRWTGAQAPYRVLSNLQLVDSQGNVLYQTPVTPTTFYQDSSLQYYLPITGLNVNVPVNQYTSVFVRVTIVSTLPSGATSGSFEVRQNDVRAVDGIGVDRFGPVSTISGSFTLQASLAQSADWVAARNANTPKEGYVLGNPADGKAYGVKLLSFDLTAKNDNLRLTKVTLSVSGVTNISTLYLKAGNQTLDVQSASTTVNFNVVPANFSINKDQTVTLDVVADLTGGSTSTNADVSVTVTNVEGQNSLGGTTSKLVSVAGDTLHFRTLGPEISAFTANTSYTPPSQTASSSYSVVIRFNVTPRGGTIYMGTTTAVTSSFAAVELEKSPSGTSTPNAGVTVKVYQGTTDVTNSLTVGANGLFQLAENQTYTFEITAAQNGAPSGTGLYRWVVRNIKWDVDTNSPISETITWTARDMNTGYTNVQ